jgi:hypothetical protein
LETEEKGIAALVEVRLYVDESLEEMRATELVRV